MVDGTGDGGWHRQAIRPTLRNRIFGSLAELGASHHVDILRWMAPQRWVAPQKVGGTGDGECLALKVARRIRHEDVVDVLRGLFMAHGIPEHIRSDNGPEFIAAGLRRWLDQSGVGPLYISPGSPWENGYAESFNSRFRDEFLGCEVFDDVHSAQALGTAWRVSYNEYRPHSSLGYQTPAEFARTCIASTATSATPQPPFQQSTSLQP
jgi:transposase InsO family protein